MKFKMVSTTACETIYKVKYQGETVGLRVWAIVGGKIAIAFEDYTFLQRFDVDERFAEKNHVKNEDNIFHCYLHQHFDRPIGPEIGPDNSYALSTAAAEEFIVKNVSRRNLRLARVETIKSTINLKTSPNPISKNT